MTCNGGKTGRGASDLKAPGTTKYRNAASTARLACSPLKKSKAIAIRKLLRKELSWTEADAGVPALAISKSQMNPSFSSQKYFFNDASARRAISLQSAPGGC